MLVTGNVTFLKALLWTSTWAPMRVLMAVLMLLIHIMSARLSLLAFADMNAGGVSLLVVRVVDVPGAETDQGAARVAVLPVVVGIRDVELACVLGRVAVAVSTEGGLPVVVEGNTGAYY